MSAKRIVLLCLGLLSFGSYGVLHVHAGSEAAAGIYTAEQAKRGSIKYQKQCASCHGADLDGVGQLPPLNNDTVELSSGEESLKKLQLQKLPQ